jgi:predicted alpha/beta-hydrolase family hydrolase
VTTASGPGRWLLDEADDPGAALLLGHGAGGGPESADLAVLARRLPALGITVARFEQPWRTAGRRVAVAPPRLDEAWLEALPLLRAALPADLPLATGGRSAGARVACRTATASRAAAVVCLAFPLHPPGRPERSRAAELLAPAVPRLVLQGTRDTFGGPAEVRTAAAGDPGVRVVELPGADHGYRLPARAAFTPADLRDRLVAAVAALLGVG